MATTFKPTLKMAANAKKGLKLREKFNRGGTDVGVRRAHQLAERNDVSEADVKSMHSYFARHGVDKDGKSHEWGRAPTRPQAILRGYSGRRCRKGLGRSQRCEAGDVTA